MPGSPRLSGSCETDTSVQREADRLFHVSIITAFLEGIRRCDLSVIVNSIASLIFAVIPRYIENRYGVNFYLRQRLWVSAAALIHTLGMLGPYDRIWWWDHLVHTFSGVVVAGATDVTFQAVVKEDSQTSISREFRSIVIIGVIFGFGFFWEVLEYIIHAIANQQGFKPLLVHYGRLDTIGDIIFDLLGAALVVLFGRRAFSNITESITGESVPTNDSKI